MRKYKIIGFLKVLCHPGDFEAQDKITKEYGIFVSDWECDWGEHDWDDFDNFGGDD